MMMLVPVKRLMKRLATNQSGATSVEYGIIIAILSLAIIGSGETVWTAIRDKFTAIGTFMTNS
jgi:pilus assembly protein Flp/PilA